MTIIFLEAKISSVGQKNSPFDGEKGQSVDRTLNQMNAVHHKSFLYDP
jgi:hypothetical protein